MNCKEYNAHYNESIEMCCECTFTTGNCWIAEWIDELSMSATSVEYVLKTRWLTSAKNNWYLAAYRIIDEKKYEKLMKLSLLK